MYSKTADVAALGFPTARRGTRPRRPSSSGGSVSCRRTRLSWHGVQRGAGPGCPATDLRRRGQRRRRVHRTARVRAAHLVLARHRRSDLALFRWWPLCARRACQPDRRGDHRDVLPIVATGCGKVRAVTIAAVALYHELTLITDATKYYPMKELNLYPLPKG